MWPGRRKDGKLLGSNCLFLAVLPAIFKTDHYQRVFKQVFKENFYAKNYQLRLGYFFLKAENC